VENITVTEEQGQVTLEVNSVDYTYNAVSGKTGTNLFLFTQKVDPVKYDWKTDVLDTECADCEEAIATASLTKTALSQSGLYKPSPKTLTSSDSAASVIIQNLNLKKDITVAVTPYKNCIYIPQVDRIGEDINDQSVTVISGAAVNIADSDGKPTTAADACFCGTVKFSVTKNLSSLSETEILDKVSSGLVALLVFKDKKWQKVNTTVQGTTGSITLISDPATIRLYPFVFAAISNTAMEKFNLQGHIYEYGQMAKQGGDALYSVEGQTPIAGASIEVFIEQILDELTVDKDALTITTGSDSVASYNWGIYDTTGGVATVIPNTTVTGTGENVYTLDSLKQAALTADGQYEIRVEVTKYGLTETQIGVIKKSGETYTIQMNPVPAISEKTTSAEDGFYKIEGLDQSLVYQYKGLVTATGYEDYPFMLYGSIVDGILPYHIWLYPIQEVVTCAGSDTGVTFTPISGCGSWTDADKLSGWVSVLEANGYTTSPENEVFPCGTQMTGYGCTIQINCP